jgi:hypothetical protein
MTLVLDAAKVGRRRRLLRPVQVGILDKCNSCLSTVTVPVSASWLQGRGPALGLVGGSA